MTANELRQIIIRNEAIELGRQHAIARIELVRDANATTLANMRNIEKAQRDFVKIYAVENPHGG